MSVDLMDGLVVVERASKGARGVVSFGGAGAMGISLGVVVFGAASFVDLACLLTYSIWKTALGSLFLSFG